MSIFRYFTAPNRRVVCVASIACAIFTYSTLYQNPYNTLPEKSATEIEGVQISYSQNDQQKISTLDRTTIIVTPKPIISVSSISPAETEMGEANNQDLGYIENGKMNEEIDWFAGIDLMKLMKDSAMNKHTLNIANIFRAKFQGRAEDLDVHFRQVEGYLISAIVDDAVVDEFISFYRDFVTFENIQANEPHPLWLEEPDTIDDAIGLNKEMQQYRREVFGQMVADEVWGHEQKAYEYKLSAMKIMRDANYGEGMEIKDQILTDLHEQTWGEGELSTLENLQIQFYIKLASHGELLLSMTDKKRNEKIAELRLEVYQSDESERKNDTEKEIETES